MAPFLQIDPLSPYEKNKTLRKLPPISPGAEDTPQTKLDLLKCQYQQKLEREKQVKLMAIYKQQYQEALYRLRSSYLLENHSGPYRMSATYEHSSAERTLSQSPLAEDQDSGWTQIALNPQGKRSAGVDRSHPLRPIDRKCSGLSNILNAEGDSSDWRSLIPVDAPMWPAVTFRPSPPKGPKAKCQSSRSYLRSRETGVELRPLEDSTSAVEQRSSQCNKSTCAKGQQPRDVQNNQQSGRLNVEVEIWEKESLIQGRLRKIKEELREIQMQRDRAEEEEQGTENVVEPVRVAREGADRERSERERPGRERPGRERPERERKRSGKEGSERERSERERPGRVRSERERERSGKEGSERERSGRERSERERERSGKEGSERERSGKERSGKERSRRERAGRERAEREREKERAERERAKSDRTGRERAERERVEKVRLLEVKREMKQRQRDKIHRENVSNVDGQKAALGSSGKADKIKRSRHNKDEELNEDSSFDQCSSEEYTDHSNPFAGSNEDSEAENNDTDEDTDDRSADSNSPQNERTEWDGHYSPEEKAHCPFCGRRFVLDRLNTHIEICKKVFKRKRKVYDSAQKRAKGTDLENYQCCHKVTPAPVRKSQ
ncbi:hypothetical protein scyTo_0023543 [Scyliorhinus torazame]|uniref:C2HC/C3H-type domain-containing protein n=1 Tax=Scyliorhinus torazame TaxID=75743 RepID=A0A401QCQ4_SCYTO|nr:hypothetical protein [Scyliorhinus torazame]